MLLKLENSSKKIHNALQEDLQMVEATSCGGVVIYRGKILTLYKSYKNRYEGWVLPKGTVEEGEEYHETALREVKVSTASIFRMMWWKKMYTGF